VSQTPAEPRHTVAECEVHAAVQRRRAFMPARHQRELRRQLQPNSDRDGHHHSDLRW